MHWKSCAHVRPGAAIGAIVALLVAGGCTPRHVAWMKSSAVVLPQPPPVRAAEGPHGFLVVAASASIGEMSDEDVPLYPPVYVYDQAGRYLEQLPSNTEAPTPLSPGEYIVLVGDTDPLGVFRQVQVRIEDGKTTAVSLSDIARAPSFSELYRDLSN